MIKQKGIVRKKVVSNLAEYIKLLLHDPLTKSYYYHKYIKNKANQLLDRLAFILDCLYYCEMTTEMSIDKFDVKIRRRLDDIKAEISKSRYNYPFNVSHMDQHHFDNCPEIEEKLTFVLNSSISFIMKEALKSKQT